MSNNVKNIMAIILDLNIKIGQLYKLISFSPNYIIINLKFLFLDFKTIFLKI